jgi:DnaK suppressor protein
MSSSRALLYPHLATLLQQREAQLRAALQADDPLAAQPEADRHEVTDFKDAAAAEAMAAVEEVQAGHAARELSEVLAARRRVEDGSYGICLECGEPIDERRLLALPSTAFCTSCQHKQEHQVARPR